MATDEETKAYSRGYAAGRRNVKAKQQARHVTERRNAFWQRCYLAWLTNVSGWGWGDGEQRKNVRSGQDHARMAADLADHALEIAIKRGKV